MKTLIVAGLLTAGLLAQQPNPSREYAVSNHGALRMAVPETWKVSTKALSNPASVSLHISPLVGGAFDVQVTTVWVDPPARARTTPDSIKVSTQRAGEEQLQSAIEKTLKVQELRGEQTFGSYFALTDRNSGPGEYKFLTQGIFMTGELMSAVTILSRAADSPEVKQALLMLGSASYILPK